MCVHVREKNSTEWARVLVEGRFMQRDKVGARARKIIHKAHGNAIIYIYVRNRCMHMQCKLDFDLKPAQF